MTPKDTVVLLKHPLPAAVLEKAEHRATSSKQRRTWHFDGCYRLAEKRIPWSPRQMAQFPNRARMAAIAVSMTSCGNRDADAARCSALRFSSRQAVREAAADAADATRRTPSTADPPTHPRPDAPANVRALVSGTRRRLGGRYRSCRH